MKMPDNAPQWLKDAEISDDAVFSIEVRFGITIVNWQSGEWFKGIFEAGYFRGGEFLGGEFRGGEFLGGEFLGGEFRGGEFLGGEFRGGEFLGGEFLGGEFLGGEFRGGVMGTFSKWFVGVTFEGKIKIGCKEKTVKEWDDWFKSKEVFNTKRDDPSFKRIYAHYRAVREYKLIMDKK